MMWSPKVQICQVPLIFSLQPRTYNFYALTTYECKTFLYIFNQAETSGPGRVYLPGCDIDEEEEDCRPSKLIVDETAYIMLHNANTGILP